MRALAQDENLVKTLELEGLISRLDLSSDSSETRRPSYKELYPAGWATDTQAELVHIEALTKIVNWPIDHNRKVNNQGKYWLTIATVFSLTTKWLACYFSSLPSMLTFTYWRTRKWLRTSR